MLSHEAGVKLIAGMEAAFSDGAAFAAKAQSETEAYATVGKRANITMD